MLEIKWIKAHQDKDKNGICLTGPMTREVQLNCEQVDQLAKQGEGVLQQETLSTTALGLHDENGRHIQDLKYHL